MAKILCVLYPDPEAGYPPNYARDDIPTITSYANGQTAPPRRDLSALSLANSSDRSQANWVYVPTWRSTVTS